MIYNKIFKLLAICLLLESVSNAATPGFESRTHMRTIHIFRLGNEVQQIHDAVRKGVDLTKIIKEFGPTLADRGVPPDGIIDIVSSIASKCSRRYELGQLYMNIVKDMLQLANDPSTVLMALVFVTRKYGFSEDAIIDMMCRCYKTDNRPVAIVFNDVATCLLGHDSPSNVLITLAPIVGNYGFSQDELINMICLSAKNANIPIINVITDIASYKLRIYVDPISVVDQLYSKFLSSSQHSFFIAWLALEMNKQNYTRKEIDDFTEHYTGKDFCEFIRYCLNVIN